MAHDLIIRNGRVVDGTGAPGREADVTVDDGVVVAVGPSDGDAVEVIDVDRQVVAPGFVEPLTIRPEAC
jgi:N-acyl-D-aspartate/D-glutamate deacylase